MADKKTLLQFCDMIPPCLVRAMAMTDRVPGSVRIGFRLMTHDEVAVKSGLSCRMIQRLSATTSWKGIKIGAASKYVSGCGIDLVNRDWQADFVKRYADKDFPHITDSRQKVQLFKLMGWSK